MTDLLRAGAKMLNAVQRQHCSQEITYHRGEDSVVLSATIGTSRGTVSLEYGMREQWIARDYLISVDDLVLDGERVQPARGDRIVETALDSDDEATATVTHEVLPPSAEEPAWRFSDEHRLRYRVHTKQVQTS
jgi:hypothetical protein